MRIGIDVGSTTIKYVVLDDQNNILHKSYERHLSQITEKTLGVLKTVRKLTGENKALLSISGSAGMICPALSPLVFPAPSWLLSAQS